MITDNNSTDSRCDQISQWPWTITNFIGIVVMCGGVS
jgi:hypothetical protein